MANLLIGNAIERFSAIFISETNSIGNAPQNIYFKLKNVQSTLLLIAGNKVVERYLKAVFYICLLYTSDAADE